MPLTPPPDEPVTFRVDGREYSVTTWSDLSALRTIRFVARHATPRIGCEGGLCGTCESLVDGEARRLCQIPGPQLDGCTVITVLAVTPQTAR